MKDSTARQATTNNVVFTDDYGQPVVMTGKNIDPELHELRELCSFRATSLSERFVALIFSDTNQSTYKNAMKLKRCLSENLQNKLTDLVKIICDRNQPAWFQVLVIHNPSPQDLKEYTSIQESWNLLSKQDLQGMELEDSVDDFIKQILRNRKLINEIVKLLLCLTPN